MIAVNYSTIRNNLKGYCDRATDENEIVIEDKSYIKVNDFDKLHTNVRKLIGHFGYFGLIGTLGFIAIYLFTISVKKTFVFTSISGLIMASISECLQFFTKGRGPSIIDVFIDYSGYLVASFIVFIIIIFINRRRKSIKTA